MQTTEQKDQYNKLSYLKKIVKYLFFLFIFLLPIQTRYIYQQATLNNGAWEYGTLSLYATEILLGTIIILYIIGFIGAYSRAYRNMPLQLYTENGKKNLKNPLIFLPLALLLWSVASIFWAYDKMLAWDRCIILMEGIIVYLFIIKIPLFSKEPALSDSRMGGLGPACLSAQAGAGREISPSAKPTQIENASRYNNPEKSPCIPLYKRGSYLIPLIASAICQSMLAIYQFASQQIIANKWLGIASHLPETLGTSVVETPLRRWLRAYGSLPHPNILAAYLGIALLLFIIFIFNKSPKKNQQSELTNTEELKQRLSGILKVFAIFLISAAIIFTFSRAVWIGLFLSIIIFLVFNKLPRHPDKNKTRRHPSPALAGEGYLKMTQNFPFIPSFGFFILFLFVLFLAREPIMARISNSNRLEQKSNQERMLSYKESKDIIKENWLIGTGIGNYTLALYKKNPSLSAYEYQPVHNLFILIFAELGIFGLLIFLLFLFYITKKIIQNHLVSVEIFAECHSDRANQPPKRLVRKWRNLFIKPNLVRSTDPHSAIAQGRLSATLGMTKEYYFNSNYFIILFIFILLISLFDHYFCSLYFGVILFWICMGIIIS